MRSNFTKIGYRDLPSTKGVVRFTDKLILDDTFNLHISSRFFEEGEGWMNVISGPPFKMKLPFILFCKEGGIKININEESFTLSDRNFMICFPGFIIESLLISKDTKVGVIAFSSEDYLSLLSQEAVSVIRQQLLAPKVINLDERRMSLLTTSYNSIRSIIEMEHFSFKDDALKGCMTLLLSMLGQWVVSCEDDKDFETSRDESLFLAFLSEVKSQCCNNRKISFYAEKFHISPKYFAKLIYSASGRHPADWIREQVISEAKAMLKTGKYTVQQVSDAMSFPNASFFGKYFKAATGLSPRSYIVENS